MIKRKKIKISIQRTNMKQIIEREKTTGVYVNVKRSNRDQRIDERFFQLMIDLKTEAAKNRSILYD